MGIGQEGGVLFLAFAVATVLVMYWRVVLTVAAAGSLGLMLVGAVQVVEWFHALS